MFARALHVITNDKDKDSHALSSTSCPADTSSPNKIRKSKEPMPGDSHGLSAIGYGGSGGRSPTIPSMCKHRKMKLEWRDQYLVIRQGMLSLFKSRTVSLLGFASTHVPNAGVISCFFFFENYFFILQLRYANHRILHPFTHAR